MALDGRKPGATQYAVGCVGADTHALCFAPAVLRSAPAVSAKRARAARAHLRVHVHCDVDDARVEEDGGHEAPQLVAVHDGRRPLGLRAAAAPAAAAEVVWTRRATEPLQGEAERAC